MKRATRAGAAFAGLALLLAACSSDTTSSESTSAAATESATASESASAEATSGGGATGGELLIWADKLPGPVVDKQCKEWAAANGVSCKVVQMDGSTIQDAVLKAASSKEGPDLVLGAHDWLGALVKNGAVTPIDLGSQTANFNPAAIKAITYEGKGYGVPYAVENLALLTNKTLAPECPATLDDMVAKGQELKKAGKVSLPLALQISESGDPYHWHPLYTADGGYIFGTNADGSYNPDDLGIGQEGSIAAAKRLGQLAEDGVVKASVTLDIAQETFNDGKAAYFISGPWSMADSKKALGDDLVVCPIPNWKDSTFQATPFVGVQTFFKDTHAKNGVLADTFLTDAVMTTEFMDALYENDPRPPAWNESADKASEDPNVKTFIEFGKLGIPMPAIPAMASVWGDMGLAEYKIATGADPEKTIVAAGESIKKQIEESAG